MQGAPGLSGRARARTFGDRMARARLSHLDAAGRARMVDVGDKPVTTRVAVAAATVRMAPATLKLIATGAMPKGDVLAVARLAGIDHGGDVVPHIVQIAECDDGPDPEMANGLAEILRSLDAEAPGGSWAFLISRPCRG